jgi:hypothetical protein
LNDFYLNGCGAFKAKFIKIFIPKRWFTTNLKNTNFKYLGMISMNIKTIIFAKVKRSHGILI